jgi:hypothetical protein
LYLGVAVGHILSTFSKVGVLFESVESVQYVFWGFLL